MAYVIKTPSCDPLQLTLHRGSGEGAQNYLPKEEGRVEKNSARSAPVGNGAWTRDVPWARRESPAVRHDHCLNK